ncbi:MAG: hypothetical protein COA33_010575 [Fluviicola sp.]|nr:hypothetical protein [Fluviicola sp.]
MKLIRSIILVASVLLSFQTVAQKTVNYITYKKSCNKAYVAAIKDSAYLKAIKHLEKVQKKYGFLTGEEYMLKAYAYKKLNNSLECAENVKLAWSNYSLDFSYLFEIPELRPNIIVENFNEAEKLLVNEGYENFAKLKKSPVADSIMGVIDSMGNIDAEVRDKFNEDKSEINRAKMILIDSLNGIKFKKIVLTYGFPGEKFYPGKSSSSFILLLHLADYPIYFKQMSPIFLKEVKAGRMSPTMFLYWLDRHLFSSQKPSKYLMSLPPGTEMETNPKVDKRRLKFGVNYGFPNPHNKF